MLESIPYVMDLIQAAVPDEIDIWRVSLNKRPHGKIEAPDGDRMEEIPELD